MTREQKRLRSVCIRIREEADAKITEARRIHEEPSMFLDRDQKCRSLIAEAEGMKHAAFVLLEAVLAPSGRRSR